MTEANTGGPVEKIDKELQTLSDRLGARANGDHWFDEMVTSVRTYDGLRIPVLELAEIGEAIPEWMTDGRIAMAEGVLDELEQFLTTHDIDEVAARGYAIEILVAIRNRLVSLGREVDPGVVATQISEAMGELTRGIWANLQSD